MQQHNANPGRKADPAQADADSPARREIAAMIIEASAALASSAHESGESARSSAQHAAEVASDVIVRSETSADQRETAKWVLESALKAPGTRPSVADRTEET